MIRLKVSDCTPVSFKIRGDNSRVGFTVEKAKEVLVGGEIYDGPYTVEPTFDEQTLATKHKTLYNDIAVNAIRVERVGNTHGTTVYIGMKGD